jgi:hypothetical protein
MRQTRSQMIESLNDYVGVTQVRHGPSSRAQAFDIVSRRREPYLIEQSRQRLDLLDALATLMHIVVVAMVLKEAFCRAAEFLARCVSARA